MADDVSHGRRPHPFLVALAVVGVLALAAAGSVLVVVGLAFKSIPDFTASRGIGSGNVNGDGGQYLGNLRLDKAIAGIRLEGEVNSPMATEIVEKLREAQKDKRIVGILLEVNSPGGSVVASQEIYDTLKEVKTTKPVVAYVREMSASGAYYASASATRIVGNRGSLIGSIGVILSTVEATQLMDWLKLKPVTLKTGKLKDTGSPTREWTADDRAYLQDLINKTREQFVTDVRTERPIDEAGVALMSDGRVVLGTQALELKLIDKIGSKETALQDIAELASLATPPELIYMEPAREFPALLSEFLKEQGASFAGHLTRAMRGTPTSPIQLK